MARKPHPFTLPALVAGASLLAGAFADAKSSDKPRRLDPARVIVTIEADGSPHNVRCLSPVAISVCPLLTKAVNGWKFEPGKRGGVPAGIDIVLNLRLDAVQVGAGFALQPVDAELSVRGPKDVAMPDMPPPPYPPDSMRRGTTGMVEVELFADAGSPHYRVGRTWLNGRQPSRSNELVSAAVKAAERWPVQPRAPEVIAECTVFEFVLKPGPDPKPREKACKDTYVEGFIAPRLVTDVTLAPL